MIQNASLKRSKTFHTKSLKNIYDNLIEIECVPLFIFLQTVVVFCLKQ